MGAMTSSPWHLWVGTTASDMQYYDSAQKFSELHEMREGLREEFPSHVFAFHYGGAWERPNLLTPLSTVE